MGNLTSTSNPILRTLEADRMYQQKQLSSDPYVTFSQLNTYANKTTDLAPYAKSVDIASTYAKTSDLSNYYTKSLSDSLYLTSAQANSTFYTKPQTDFIGLYLVVGSQTTSFFNLTISSVSISSGKQLNLGQNINKSIRIWYDSNGYLTGFGLPYYWTYPTSFGSNIKINALSTISYTSAIELVHPSYSSSSATRFKLLFWFAGSTPLGIPNFTNPREAVRWIVLNRPSLVTGNYGADAGTFQGTDNYTATVSFG